MATEPNISPPPPAQREASESPQPTRQPEARAPQPPPPASSRPGGDGDIVLDIPQLAVDEMNLELHAPILEQVKLEAKGLQVGLYAKVDLDNVVAIAGKRPARRLPDIDATETSGGEQGPGADEQQRAAAEQKRVAGVRQELEQLVESAKEAYEEVSDRDLEQQVREFYDTARDAYARVTGRADGGGQGGDGARAEGAGDTGGERSAESAGRRALEITKQGGKAAGLTAAGVAGGAALESVRRSGGLRFHMPVQRRGGSVPKAVVDKVRDRIG
jgi:hypothetical protein